MRKTIVVLLLVTMVLMAACTVPSAPSGGGQAADPTKAPATDSTAAPASSNEKVTLRAYQWALENQQTDFNNLWFYQELEKKTNVHVDFEPIREGDWETKINLMLDSGDNHDLIIRGSVDIEEYGVTQKILVPLDDYLEKYMPNYYPRLSMNNSNAAIPASDGKTYYIGYLVAQNVNHEANNFINKTWLDNLGLEIPKTIDELTTVLKAFRDGDPNKNGQKKLRSLLQTSSIKPIVCILTSQASAFRWYAGSMSASMTTRRLYSPVICQASVPLWNG